MEQDHPPALIQPMPPAAAAFEPALRIGGEWRMRVEHHGGPNYGLAGSDYDRLLHRLTVHAEMAWTSRLTTYVELADTRAFDDKPVSPADESGTDLQSAWVRARVSDSLDVTAGRQSVVFNPAQRFVSLREGPGVRRAFDGVRAVWRRPGWRLEALASRPVRNGPQDFDDGSNPSMSFNVVYASHGGEASSLDVYVFDYANDKARFASASGRERRGTIGLRLAGAADGYDYDVEGAWQFGRLGDQTISGWALAGSAGYTFQSPLTPRLGLEAEFGSGDRTPGDKRLETFNPLFPYGGVFDQFSLTGWSNLGLIRAGLTLKPTQTLKVGASVAARFQLERADGVYLNPAVLIPGSTGAPDHWLGMATRLDLEWAVRDDLILTGQALWSDAEGGLAQAGANDGFHAFVAVKTRF